MKVTTLACIQGSRIPVAEPKQTLDIGAGTGLLSLMIAQKYNCHIDAVEIEYVTFKQLTKNVAASPWHDRIKCYHEDIARFAEQTIKTYDLIITNPPFFSNQHKSPNSRINQARHDDSLTIETLVKLCDFLLAQHGKISILLPPFETVKLKGISSRYSLHIIDQLSIYNRANKPAKAIISTLSRQQLKGDSHKLIIKGNNPGYSEEFTSLLKDYYLHL